MAKVANRSQSGAKDRRRFDEMWGDLGLLWIVGSELGVWRIWFGLGVELKHSLRLLVFDAGNTIT